MSSTLSSVEYSCEKNTHCPFCWSLQPGVRTLDVDQIITHTKWQVAGLPSPSKGGVWCSETGSGRSLLGRMSRIRNFRLSSYILTPEGWGGIIQLKGGRRRATERPGRPEWLDHVQDDAEREVGVRACGPWWKAGERSFRLMDAGALHLAKKQWYTSWAGAGGTSCVYFWTLLSWRHPREEVR